MSFLITLLALGIVIFIHELGHLLAAKRAGVGALEFSIGMGPKLFSKTVNETEYSLRLFPVGGFVKLAGLDDGETECPPELNYFNKSYLQRLLTLAAGAFMNLILGLCIYIVLFVSVGKQIISPLISEVSFNTPAAVAGLEKGDRLVSLNGIPIQDAKDDFIQVVNHSVGKPLTLVYTHHALPKTVIIVPVANKHGLGIIGVSLMPSMVKLPFFQAIPDALAFSFAQIKNVFISLKLLFTGKVSLSEISGPVGIIQLASFGFKQGFYQFMSVIAMINMSLGVANLLPFPVLDGGHIMLLGLEALRKKRLSEKTEGWITTIGASILIALMVIVIGNDLLNWEARNHLFKGFHP